MTKMVILSESNHKLNPLDSLVIENKILKVLQNLFGLLAKSDCPIKLHMFSIHTNKFIEIYFWRT